MSPVTLLCGEQHLLAIQCDVSDVEKRLGNIYFWVSGKQFGNDLFSFDLDNYFHRISEDLERIPNFDRIAGLSAHEYELLVDCLYDDFTPQDCKCFRDLAKAEGMIDATIWRDYFAADHILLGIADGSENQAIHAIDQEANVYASIVVEPRSFQRCMQNIVARYRAYTQASKVAGSP